MRNFFKTLLSIFAKLFIFIIIFIGTQLNRELLMRPLIVNTIGPFKTERHLYLDETLNGDESYLIGQAAHQWEVKTKGLVKFTIIPLNRSSDFLTLKDPKAIVITRMSIDDPFIEDVEDQLGKLLGLHTKRFAHEIIVLLPERIRSKLEFRATAMHELGHALGMEHNPRKFTLMYPSEDFGAWSITDHDLKQFCLLYFCDAKKLVDKN